MNETKKDKNQDDWFERHGKLRWLVAFIFSLPFAATIAVVSFWYGIVGVLMVESLRATIEAEATIIGFFAIVVAYLLNSYDLRIDRLEQELFDLASQTPIKDATRLLMTGKMQNAVRERKKNTVYVIAIVGACLAISLFLLIIALGFVSLLANGSNSSNPTLVGIAFWTNVIGTMLLFTGTFGIFSCLLSIAREREPKEVEEWRDTLMKCYQQSSKPQSTKNENSQEVHSSKIMNSKEILNMQAPELSIQVVTMIYDLKTGVVYSGIPIGKGQKELIYLLGQENEDYDVIPAFANWETTVKITKTEKGFTVKFSKECPRDDGVLYLNIIGGKKGTATVTDASKRTITFGSATSDNALK